MILGINSTKITETIFAITLFISVLGFINPSSHALTSDPSLTYANFEEQINNYKPMQKEKVSKKDFDYGSMIMNEIKSNVKNDSNGYNCADYFNVLSAFLTLKESDENIKLAFEKFKNSDGSCDYFIGLADEVQKNKKYDIIRTQFVEQIIKCKSNQKVKAEFNIVEYCKNNNLNLYLVQMIKQINETDKKYRSTTPVNWEKQNVIDKQNQLIIDSLYGKYKTYIGKTLVGGKYESTMWAVIQHSNVEMMERYLPVVHKSFLDNELSVTPFKMLLDRFYGLKYGYQFFGSQTGFGFEFADEKTKNEIMKKYGLE